METRTYLVPNISCNHCIMTIKNELKEIDGVEEVSADLNTKEVVILFSGKELETRIVSTLKEINYPPSGL